MPQVKITNGQVSEYPYSEMKLKKDNPNTSFPSVMSVQSLEAHGVYQVINGVKPSYDERTQELQKSSQPTLSDGSWTLEYSVRDKTTEEVAEFDAEAAAAVRIQRDKLLSESDWVTIRAKELGQDVPLDWYNYRGDLRQVPEQAGFPHNITWPEKPNG